MLIFSWFYLDNYIDDDTNKYNYLFYAFIHNWPLPARAFQDQETTEMNLTG